MKTPLILSLFLLFSGVGSAQTVTTYRFRIPKGVTEPANKNVTYDPNFRGVHVAQQSVIGSLMEMGPGLIPKYLVPAPESIVGAKHFALPPMERPEIDSSTTFRFEFRYKAEKLDLSEPGTHAMKPMALAIKAKLAEAVKFDDQSKYRLIVNIYANDGWFNIGMFDVGFTVGVEAGLFEDRKAFNGLAFVKRHTSSKGKKGETRSPEVLKELGEWIGWDLLTANDFLPLEYAN